MLKLKISGSDITFIAELVKTHIIVSLQMEGLNSLSPYMR